MKTRSIVYWVTTALTGLVFLFGGVMDVMQPPDVVEGITDLGYLPRRTSSRRSRATVSFDA